MAEHSQIVAIDGLRGTGKSWLASSLRLRFGCNVLDIGPVFRLIAWLVDREHAPDLVSACEVLTGSLEARRIIIHLNIRCKMAASMIEIDGQNLEHELWHPRLDSKIRHAADSTEVVLHIRELARRLIGAQQTIIVGREIGSHLFPDSSLKIVLHAKDETRRERKSSQLINCISEAPLHSSIDQSEPALCWEHKDDVFLINTTNLSREDVLEQATSYIIRRLNWVDKKHLMEADKV